MTHVLGVVPVVGRGPLVHGSVGGVSLVELAVALVSDVCSSVVVVTADTEPLTVAVQLGVADRRGVDVLSLPREDASLRLRLRAVDQIVVHDPLCPLVTQEFVRQLLADSVARTLVAIRPVVDTIKATDDGILAGTVDRERLRIVSSPLVMPADVLNALPDLAGALADLTGLVADLRSRSVVDFVIAPASARRIEDASGLRLISSIAAVSDRIGERS